LRFLSFGGYGLALAVLALVVFGAIECPSWNPTPSDPKIFLKCAQIRPQKIAILINQKLSNPVKIIRFVGNQSRISIKFFSDLNDGSRLVQRGIKRWEYKAVKTNLR